MIYALEEWVKKMRSDAQVLQWSKDNSKGERVQIPNSLCMLNR